MTKVNLADVKAHLSELVQRVEAGETADFETRQTGRRDRPDPKAKEQMKALTASMSQSAEPVDSDAFIRTLRDNARY